MTVQGGTVYPPYLTGQCAKCPVFYDLSKRWQRRQEEWTPYILLGRAIAAGLEQFRKDVDLDRATQIAEDIVKAGYTANPNWSLKGLLKHVRNGMQFGSETDLGMETVLAVERQFGRTRPDVVGRRSDGSLIVVDDKVKVKLDTNYISSELMQWETDNQIWQNAWVVGQYYGELVGRTGVHLIILSPEPQAVLHTVVVTEQRMAFWLRGAKKLWQEMEGIDKGEVPVPRWTSCMGRFGPCDFHEGCHALEGDETAFPALYDEAKKWR